MRRHHGSLTRSALVALVAVAGCGDMASRATTPPRAGATGGGEVRGYVAAHFSALADKGVPSTIRLSGATVFLKNVTTGAPGPHATTNAHGRFRLPRHAPGRYEVCAEAPGFVASCAALPIKVENAPVILTRDVVIAPSRGVLRGRVLLADGTPCYHDRPFFAPPTFATVRLTDGAGAAVGAPVTANGRGEYVVAGLPAPGAFRLIVRCAGAETTESLTLGPNDLAGINPLDVTLANAPPQIVSLVITNAAGVPIQYAMPGEVVAVTVRAQDSDGDPLHYVWGDGSSGFRSLDSPTIQWKLAAVPTVNVLFVEIGDGRGGFANGHVAIATGPVRALFTGRVSEASGAPLAGVIVDVDGTPTTTGADGAFAIVVGERPRHVMTVKQPGYALLARVFTTGASGLDLRLERMQRRICDPAASCTLQGETRRARAAITIDAGSVVDGEGNVVRAPFEVAIHAYDLAQPNPIPGELGGFDLRGNPVAMTSYGAVDIDLRDRAGRPLKLAPGAKAKVSIPIHPDLLAGAPPTIPFLRYDETSGYWTQETTGTRVGDHYEAMVTHLSEWNADVLFPNSACIRVEVKDVNDTQRAPYFPFTLHMDAQGVKRDFNVTESLNVLYRLAPNTMVTLEIHPLNDPVTVLKSFSVSTGGAIDPKYELSPPFGLPPKPYDQCHGSVVLALDVPPASGPFLNIEGAGNDNDAIAYYKTIGALDDAGQPTQGRGTFTGWKATNNLSAKPENAPPEEKVGVYYDERMLKLAFEVHCRQNGSDVACYQAIYPGPCGQAAGCAADAALMDALNRVPSATLAMEYSAPPQGGPPVAKFYAFDNMGKLSNKVVLDRQGPKYVPYTCISCHFSYNTSANIGKSPDLATSFLPFDLWSFVFPAGLNQKIVDQFRELNAAVLVTKPNQIPGHVNMNDPVGQFVTGMFPGGQGTPANLEWIPPGWMNNNMQAALYRNVTRPYCRACHLSLVESLEWASYDEWGNDPRGIQAIVCLNYHMPQAEVPFLGFWLNANPAPAPYLASPVTGLDFYGMKYQVQGCPR